MKISTRLSISFSIIACSILITFGLTVYLFSSNHRDFDFRERLKGRVIVTEKIFLEKESFSQVELEKITSEFLHTLPEETEEVVQILPNHRPEFKHHYSPDVQDKIITSNNFYFKDSNLQGHSRKFHVKGKDYIIVVTAIDEIGLQNQSFLKGVIFLLVLIGIPITFIGSFLLTRKEMLPILKKIDKANSISASNLHRRLNVANPDDELGKMAIAFNKLLSRLEASFDTQKSFIRNASHEIRNPLTAIMGEAEITLGKTRTSNEYHESLKTILSEAETLNLTVNNLLQLSKVTANEEIISYEIIQLDELLIRIKDSFDFVNVNNQVTLNIPPTVENETYLISGNKNLLKTAIINLLDNACKFSSNDRVDIFLTSDDKWLKLVIADVGIGVLNEDLKKILTPFYRGINTLKIRGSGIGLSLSSKIIDLHQGILEVHSQINIGTEVHVKLPHISN